MRTSFQSQQCCDPGEDCPEYERLWLSAMEELEGSDNEEIILHLAHCPECASIWQLARKLVPDAPVFSAPTLPATVQARVPLWRRPQILTLAALLILAMGLGLHFALLRQGLDPVNREQQTRERILPRDGWRTLPREHCLLRWSSGPEGSRYPLNITTEDLDVLRNIRNLKSPEYLFPEEFIPKEENRILWRITVRLPDGERISSDTFTTQLVDAS